MNRLGMGSDEWLQVLDKPARRLKERLREIFGDNEALIEYRLSQYRDGLRKFADVYGRQEGVVIVRAPARVNLMGVHIEHRGGYVNYFTIQKEIVMIASPRNDSRIKGFNVDEKFRPFSFSIKEFLPLKKRGNWLRFISETKITSGGWANYIKGAILRLQDITGKELSGMNLVVGGNIPEGSGLSSSSALVVATSLVCIAFNNLKIAKKDLVTLCGEAEWYVGTRGGAGDHAAMLFGKKGYISHLRFFPFIVEDVPLPSGYTIIICNSLKKAPKSKEARDAFNTTIASYEIAFKLIKKNYPEFSRKIKHLRDVNQDTLNAKETDIYEILRSLPQRIKREELLRIFPAVEMERLFSTHMEPRDGYRPRGAALFALAECERSKITEKLLRENRIKELGKLMYISHDGDRVVSFDKNGKRSLYKKEVTNEYLERLSQCIKDKKKESQILFQPGALRCSCEELDELVDIAKTIPGVVGAGLTGAGFGGAIIALVRNREAKGFLRDIEKRYYQAKGLPFAAEVCIPTDGAGML